MVMCAFNKRLDKGSEHGENACALSGRNQTDVSLIFLLAHDLLYMAGFFLGP